MADTERIQLAHGGGGQLTAELIEQVILPALGTQQAGQLTDAATLSDLSGEVVFTTDSYVVKPAEFPGGNIGKLAVCGTVNDLAVCGAIPKALSLGVIIEEGLEIDLLSRVLKTLGETANAAGVAVVTGDTKVVERGALDGIMLNTAGIGVMSDKANLGFERIGQGDAVVLSGPLGEHSMAVMGMRKGLSFSADLISDCACIHELAHALIDRLGDAVRFMRDPTRGGLAATLVEISTACSRDIEINDSAIPTNPTALAVSEMLGLDMMAAANEGKLVAVVAADAADEAVAILAEYKIAATAARIATIGAEEDMPLVEMVTKVGGRRVVQMPYGEELPRIC